MKRIKKFFLAENGEVNLIAIIVISIVVIAVAIIFQEQLTNLVYAIFDSINGRLCESNNGTWTSRSGGVAGYCTN